MRELDNSSSPVKVRLGPNGRIVIPAALREQLGLEPGATLFLEAKDGVLHVEALPARIRRIQQELAPFRSPGILASDELIAQRRAEAWGEELELRREMKQEGPRSEEKIA